MAAPLLAAVLALSLATACAPAQYAGAPPTQPRSQAKPPHGHAHHDGEVPAWRLADVAATEGRLAVLRSSSGAALVIETARARLMNDVARRISAAAGGEVPDWLIIGTPAANAYASYQGTQPVVATTLGMVKLLGDDADAWGALFGHEIAHFRLGHHEAKRTRREAADVGSSLAGIALSLMGLGVGSAVADAGGKLVERAFNRDDERDADRLGLEIQLRAGFDAQGALRLQEALLDARTPSSPSFLSTHPGGEERIERLRRLIDAPVR